VESQGSDIKLETGFASSLQKGLFFGILVFYRDMKETALSANLENGQLNLVISLMLLLPFQYMQILWVQAIRQAPR
jgi:hypothetical protein